MSYLDFQKSRYIRHLPKTGLDVRLLNPHFPNQNFYMGPLFEYNLDISQADSTGDFAPQNASIDELEQALKSPSARVRMRAIITLSARGNISPKTILYIASMQHDKGEWDYEFGKTYGKRFCPAVDFCAKISLPVLAHTSPSATLDLITGIAEMSEQVRGQVLDVLNIIGVDAVAAALAICDSNSPQSLGNAQAFLRDKLSNISALLSAYLDDSHTKEAKVVQFLASTGIARLNNFVTTMIEQNVTNGSWIFEAIPYQIEAAMCSQLADRAGTVALPYLIRGLDSSNKRARLACASVISSSDQNRDEAKAALQTAVQNERSFLTRWSLRRYAKRLHSTP
jgi:hypothetical protein